MEHSNVKEWALAVGVLYGGASIGYVIGQKFGHPLVGSSLGLAAGLAFNWFRECPVCRRGA